MEETNSSAAANYAPQPYYGRLTLFRTMNDLKPNLSGSEPGWRSLAVGGLELHEIPGSLEDIATEPNVRTLADKLQQCLDRAQLPIKHPVEAERTHVERRQVEKPAHSRPFVRPSQRRALNG